jgi:hypothetical protein
MAARASVEWKNGRKYITSSIGGSDDDDDDDDDVSDVEAVENGLRRASTKPDSKKQASNGDLKNRFFI